MKDERLRPRRTRRDVLRLAAPALVLPLVGWKSASDDVGDDTAAVDAPEPLCVARPGQTEGPYFADVRLMRSDIRSNTEDGRVQPGVPLRLTFRVSRLSGRSCAPLPNAIIDLWQCNAEGVYSAFRDFQQQFDARDEDFLRGYQLTGPDGTSEFRTIYPGWYGGRTVHIHFKIRTEPDRAYEFTSQLYFDDAVTDRVHAREPYASKGPRDARNTDDRLYRREGERLMVPLTKDGEGYAGVFNIALAVPLTNSETLSTSKHGRAV